MYVRWRDRPRGDRQWQRGPPRLHRGVQRVRSTAAEAEHRGCPMASASAPNSLCETDETGGKRRRQHQQPRDRNHSRGHRVKAGATAKEPIYLKSMATEIEIGSLISRRPDIRGGRPCVAGTGVSVRRIARWHDMGQVPEEIVQTIGGQLSLAQVHAALAYYYANQAE